MMARYKNPFYSPKYDNSKPIIQTDAKPIGYKGYLIYERIKGICFDIVKDGACVGMYAGINGAKEAVDKKRI
jgi:hypothetical protein